jgi:hypothetical protein
MRPAGTRRVAFRASVASQENENPTPNMMTSQGAVSPKMSQTAFDPLELVMTIAPTMAF